MKSKNILALLTAVVISEAAGLVGSVFTVGAIPTWYVTLAKPALNPPAWVFAPVWTILYLLMGISAFLVWRDGRSRKEGKRALWVFVPQLVLNVLWSVLFFGLHSPALGLICIVALWLAILWTMIAFWKISRLATYLLVPYVLWVTFAAYLNLAIFVLNR